MDSEATGEVAPPVGVDELVRRERVRSVRPLLETPSKMLLVVVTIGVVERTMEYPPAARPGTESGAGLGVGVGLAVVAATGRLVGNVAKVTVADDAL